MKNMYIGLWIAGIKNIKSFSDWALLLIMMSVILFLGYFGAKYLGNPIDFIKTHRLAVLIILIVFMLLVGSKLSPLTSEKVPDAPYGIVSFELAKDKIGEDGKIIRVEKILSQWRTENKIEDAKKQVKLDFYFLFAYSALLAFICFWIADSYKTTWIAPVGLTLGWIAPIAGILDVIENIALLRMLHDGASESLANIAFWSALPKLVITLYLIIPFILFMLSYSMLGLLPRLWQKNK